MWKVDWFLLSVLPTAVVVNLFTFFESNFCLVGLLSLPASNIQLGFRKFLLSPRINVILNINNNQLTASINKSPCLSVSATRYPGRPDPLGAPLTSPLVFSSSARQQSDRLLAACICQSGAFPFVFVFMYVSGTSSDPSPALSPTNASVTLRQVHCLLRTYLSVCHQPSSQVVEPVWLSRVPVFASFTCSPFPCWLFIYP